LKNNLDIEKNGGIFATSNRENEELFDKL